LFDEGFNVLGFCFMYWAYRQYQQKRFMGKGNLFALVWISKALFYAPLFFRID
jgi:hypothetical protein